MATPSARLLNPPINQESAFKGKRKSLPPLAHPTTEQKTGALFHAQATTPSGFTRKLFVAIETAKEVEPKTSRSRAQSLPSEGNEGQVVREDSEVRRYLQEFGFAKKRI